MLLTLASGQNDLLQWVLDEAVPRHSTDAQIAERVLVVNFGAIHTTSSVSVIRAP